MLNLDVAAYQRTSTGRLDWRAIFDSFVYGELCRHPFWHRYEVWWGVAPGRGEHETYRTLRRAQHRFNEVKDGPTYAMLVDTWRDRLTLDYVGQPLEFSPHVPGLLDPTAR